MKTYSKWTARIALAVLCGVPLAIAPFARVYDNKNEAVWPLSRHFVRHHLFAGMYVAVGWFCVGAALLILVGFTVHGLLVRAEWAGRSR